MNHMSAAVSIICTRSTRTGICLTADASCPAAGTLAASCGTCSPGRRRQKACAGLRKRWRWWDVITDVK